MSKVFLSHSSKDKERYINMVYNRLVKDLGHENVIIDEMSFEEGRYTSQEINNLLEITDLFVLFISDESLESKWVQNEIFNAKELWDQNKLSQIMPIIIDEKISFDDNRIPEWMQKNYNIKLVKRPTKVKSLIVQRMIEISYEKHPRLKERDNIFVGRNEYLQKFEERIDDFMRNKPICVITSGIKSVGRSTLLKQCLKKSNVIKETYQEPRISLRYDESIEDFILKIYDLGLCSDNLFFNMFKQKLEVKQDILINLIKEVQAQKDILFIEDEGCIINHEGEMSEWFIEVIKSSSLINKITFCIISKFRYTKKIYGDLENKIYSMELEELKKIEREGLLNRCLEFEEIEVDVNDKKVISNLLTGYPEQVFYTVGIIKGRGIYYLKKNIDMIVDFNNQKVGILLNDIETDNKKMEFLRLLSEFDYISPQFLFDIVGDESYYKILLDELFTKAICEYAGIANEYIRINETIKDYIIRSEYNLSEVFTKKLEDKLKLVLNSIDSNDYNIPDLLYSLKVGVKENIVVKPEFIIPSLYLKTMTDLYNTHKYKDVIQFADKALEDEDFMDIRIVFEIRYLLCLSLAKQGIDRFKIEVQNIKGADHNFLFGFYYRQIGKYDKALEKINESLRLRPNFSKAKREKVQLFLAMQEYTTATELAKENYENYKDNPYHIQAYFTCLIKAKKSKETNNILNELLKALSNIKNDTAKEMLLRCKAQYEAFYEDNYENAIELIEEAISLNPNIHYAKFVKFDICEKFNKIDKMKEILNFFLQGDYKQRYHNNIICFQSIILAKSGNVEEAMTYFENNIRHYTDQAIEKFDQRLLAYLDN